MAFLGRALEFHIVKFVKSSKCDKIKNSKITKERRISK